MGISKGLRGVTGGSGEFQRNYSGFEGCFRWLREVSGAAQGY